MTDTLIKEVKEALETAIQFIASEYRDERLEPEGEWLAFEARKPFEKICNALAKLERTTQSALEGKAND